MYREAEVTAPVIVPDHKMTNPVENKEIAVKEKNRVVKKQLVKNDKSIETREVIELIKPKAEEEKMITKEIKKIENTEVTVVPSKENVSEKIVKHKKRRLSTKLFSRGALDERYIKEEIKLDVPKTKTEPGKIVRKDSDGENKKQ